MKRTRLLIVIISIVGVVCAGIFIGTRIFYNHNNDGRIPFLPIDANNSNISLHGQNSDGDYSRIAVDSEKAKIVDMLNSMKNFKRVHIPKYGNGKPQPINIQVYTKDKASSDVYFYITEQDDGSILMGELATGIGYIIEQPEILNLFKELHQ